jgi:hypothetical protein
MRWEDPEEFDVHDDAFIGPRLIMYYVRAFRILEAEYCFNDYTVVFPWNAEKALPSTGDKTVVVIWADERCRVPKYIGDIAALFKPYGMYPPYRFRLLPLRLAQIELVAYIRNIVNWLPNAPKWLFVKRNRAHSHLIPLGYGIPHNLNIINPHRRRHIISFQGSVVTDSTNQFFRHLIGMPKKYCRDRLLQILAELALEFGSEKINIGTTPSFEHSITPAAHEAYARTLENTLICVAPRGTSYETYRLYDGLRCGCIVISDYLPRFPFYENAPIIQLRDWRQLPRIVKGLLDDPQRISFLHKESLKFWRTKLSERVLAKQIARALNLTRSASNPQLSHSTTVV